MNVEPIGITIYLDPKYKPADIWDFYLNAGFHERVIPLYVWKDGHEPPFVEEEVQDERQVSFLPSNYISAITREQLSSPRTYLKCGFRVKHNDSGKFEPWTRVFIPEVAQQGDKLLLKWRPEPALHVEVVSYDYGDGPVLNTQMIASHGLWGQRYQWLKAHEKIISQLREREFEKVNNDQLETLSREISEKCRNIRQLETKIADMRDTQQFLWTLARTVGEKFGKTDKSYYINPSHYRAHSKNFDVITYQYGQLPEEPFEIADEVWLTQSWLECFRWDAPEILNEMVKSYWTHHSNEEEFISLIQASFAGMKSTWDDLVEVITERPETDAMIELLLGWLLDINWPGAGHAWEHLCKEIGMRALPVIEQNMKMARENKNMDWLNILTWIKEDILENNEAQKTEE